MVHTVLKLREASAVIDVFGCDFSLHDINRQVFIQPEPRRQLMELF